jgi:Phospholipase_D-nuclease N-terminal
MLILVSRTILLTWNFSEEHNVKESRWLSFLCPNPGGPEGKLCTSSSSLEREVKYMSENRGCLANTLLFCVIIFLPFIGHIIATLMVLEDDHSLSGKILWLAVIWLMPIPVVIGPLLYLLFGQRSAHRGRVMFGQSSYGA